MDQAKRILEEMIASGMSLTDERLVKQSQKLDKLINEHMKGVN